MGFYGNIQNNNRANLNIQFDRKYHNRFEMESNCATDGVYAGRYVLVEYDLSWEPENITNDKFVMLYKVGDKFSTAYNSEISPNYEDNKIYRVVTLNSWVTDTTVEPEDLILEYYSNEYYIYKNNQLTLAANSDSPYVINFNIDREKYGDGGRGWDSTVWVKNYDNNGNPKYVNIAELNSVVPTFAISVDPPTELPQAPHFDEAHTNIFYNLHLQPNWGFRVATVPESSEEKSDIDLIEQADGTKVKKIIYFNQAGFEPQINKETSINKTDNITNNEITLSPTASSKMEYNDHNNPGQKKTANDIQELRIKLPAIGNMMSKAWDIIHGEQRKNERNGSLQGRLDSFNQMYENQIPVKIVDGTLVGSRINNSKHYDADETWPKNEQGESTKPVDILDDKTSPGFERDDAWIKTTINTNELKSGDKNKNNDQKNNSGISIHHDFHATVNTTSELNKNDNSYIGIKNDDNTPIGDTKREKIALLLNKPVATTDDNKKKEKDSLKLYTPYVDAKGHVVGHNTETVILPYGFKTVAINSTSNEAKASTSNDTGDLIATSTQDTLTIENNNRWISISTSQTDNSITIGHAAAGGNSIKSTVNSSANMGADIDENKAIKNLSFGSTFNVPYISYDEVGHVTSSGNYTVTIPKGGLEDTEASTDGATVLTKINFTADSGEIKTEHKNVGALLLTDHDDTVTGHVSATDSISGAFKKIDSRLDESINDLDMSIVKVNDYSIIDSIKQENGKIEVTTNKNLEDIKLASNLTSSIYTEEENENGEIQRVYGIQYIKADDTLIDALDKLQERINDNENKIGNASIGSGSDYIAATGLHAKIENNIITVESSNTDEYSAVYKFKKGNSDLCTINIPKDMVVQSGEVVTLTESNAEGKSPGTYIKLILANSNDTILWIPVDSLIEYVTGGNTAEINIAVDANHVVTATINDNSITKVKLDSGVQASLDLADSAIQTNTQFTYKEATEGESAISYTIGDLMKKVAELEARINELTNSETPTE